ncbi:glutathione S-transferase family protein [Paracoccus spongiarum]|uniref:Glutathione S-transferase n=1 Tax=Paracoccus spongiarum TaxID=3064387 RepID=A0ABT9JGC7_9RHOB|nr:glutathione S-transferase [Paracoccus sp. 2205BS29-5]MDP5308853.1 glutathione S-transferase [Paracoccus sp. 2205BS29-5]
MTLTLTTYDWVPQMPRGLVRDLRVRWACEELGRPYSVETVPLRDRGAAHQAAQPFHQVPFIRDGDRVLFESGAILLHLAEGTHLLPEDRRPEITQWLIAALNSVETWLMAYFLARVVDDDDQAAERRAPLVTQRLAQLDAVLAQRDWIAGPDFTVADLMLADVSRQAQRFGLLGPHAHVADHLARATARRAFARAFDDHMAHWAAADAAGSPA